MSKEICIISANCQGAYLKRLLAASPEFAERFDVHYFVNYNQEIVPDDLLGRCKLLIYQPLGEQWGELSAGHLMDRLPQGAMRLAVNYITSPLYWPFMAQDTRNTPDTDHPFGQFPYGDSLIQSLLAEGMSPEEVFRNYLDPDFIRSRFDPAKIVEEYVQQQRDLESRRDQQLLDYILANHQETKLFESFNHPAVPLCVRQTDDLLSKLGYPALKDLPDLSYIRIFQQPVHPAIAEAMGLKFECRNDTSYRIWGTPLTFDEYTKAYIEWDVGAIGKVPVPPKKNTPDKPPVSRNPTTGGDGSMIEGERQVLFLHLPKTAGSSLNKMLIEAYGLGADYPHFNSTVSLLRAGQRRMELPLILGHVNYTVADILRPDPFIFTFLRDPVKRAISAFEFMKSHPEVWLGKLAQGSITEYYENPMVSRTGNNLQTRLLGADLNIHKHYATFVREKQTPEQYYANVMANINLPADEETLERAKRRLETMDFFGFTDTFDDDVADLFSLLGKPCPSIVKTNVTPESARRRSSYTPEELELVHSLNRFDMELYRYAKELRETRRTAPVVRSAAAPA